jgi:hypothetical protein
MPEGESTTFPWVGPVPRFSLSMSNSLFATRLEVKRSVQLPCKFYDACPTQCDQLKRKKRTGHAANHWRTATLDSRFGAALRGNGYSRRRTRLSMARHRLLVVYHRR